MRFSIAVVQLLVSCATSAVLLYERQDNCVASLGDPCDPSNQFPCCTNKFHIASCNEGAWSITECDNGCARDDDKHATCFMGPGD